jgi:hypothetical protein
MTAALCPRCAAAGVGGHVSGPTGSWELGIAGLGAVLVTLALAQALRLLLRPGEKTARHIKRAVLDDAVVRTDEVHP